MSKRLKQLSDHDLLVAAFTAAKTNQHPLAIEHFKEAQRRDPGDPFVLMEMAKSYYATHHPDACRSRLERVGELAKSDAQLLLPLSSAYQAVREIEQAIAIARQAEPIEPLCEAACLRQAELLEKTNALDEAEAALERAANQSSGPAVLAMRAKLARRRGDHEAARAILGDLIPELSAKQPANAAMLRYDLAAILDKLGDYPAAMQALEQAKTYHVGTDEYRVAQRGRRGVYAQLEGASASVTAQDCAAWANDLDPPAHQLAFLLGHPRSGTTLIEQALDGHHGLLSADEMEMFHTTSWMPHVMHKAKAAETTLADYLRKMPTDRVQTSREDYGQAWSRALPSSVDHPVWLDKNPALITQLTMIARLFPDAKIVFALRDPRDVVLSAFMQPVGVNAWSINWLTLQETVDYYCFAMQMWLDLRDKLANDWIEVRYEDTVGDLPGQAKRATEYLGLEWDPTQADIQKHVKTKTVHSPTYSDVSKPIYRTSVGRWERYAEYLKPFEEKLAPFINAFGYKG